MQHTSHDVSPPAQPGSDVTALQARIADLEQKLAANTEHVKSQAFYASLLEHVNDAVIAVDADLQVLSWNRAAEQIYGWSAHEAVGRVGGHTPEYPPVDMGGHPVGAGWRWNINRLAGVGG